MAMVVMTVMIEPLMIGTMIAEEDLPLVGAVKPRGLEDLDWDALDRGRQDDHREAGLQPDEDDDQQERVDVQVRRVDPRPPDDRRATSRPR